MSTIIVYSVYVCACVRVIIAFMFAYVFYAVQVPRTYIFIIKYYSLSRGESLLHAFTYEFIYIYIYISSAAYFVDNFEEDFIIPVSLSQS